MSDENLKYDEVESESAALLKKHHHSTFRDCYVRCRGVLLPYNFRKFGDDIRRMEIRDDDVWVCSFPKTGTTWTQEMVWCILNDLNFEGAKQLLPERFPSLEHSPSFYYGDLMAAHPEMIFPHYALNSLDYIDKQPSTRFIKSHLPFHLLPTKLQENHTNAKIVYITRNARDTCVSYYHQNLMRKLFKGDFNVFCDLFLKDAVNFAPFWDHVLSYWEQKHKNILFLQFEDMKKDLKSVIIKTAEFFGKEMTEEGMQQLMDHLKFENMKNNPAFSYGSMTKMLKKYHFIDPNASFLRCGEVGQWKDNMTEENVKKFANLERERFQGTGFSFV